MRTVLAAAFFVLLTFGCAREQTEPLRVDPYSADVGEAEDGLVTRTPNPDRRLVRLESFSCTTDSAIGFAFVEGVVVNAGDVRIENLMAVAWWFSSGKEFITSDDTLVEYDPLLVGQASPFKVITRYNPRMDRCNVTFKDILGATIPVAPAQTPTSKAN